MFSFFRVSEESKQRAAEAAREEQREFAVWLHSRQLSKLPPGAKVVEEMDSRFWIVEVRGNTYLAQWLSSEYHWDFVPHKCHEKVQLEPVSENCS